VPHLLDQGTNERDDPPGVLPVGIEVRYASTQNPVFGSDGPWSSPSDIASSCPAGSRRSGVEKCIVRGTLWVVVEADDKQTIQQELGEIVDQLPYKGHSVFLVQSASMPPLPKTFLECPTYGVGIFREERRHGPLPSV
jgi:hypothetical protein